MRTKTSIMATVVALGWLAVAPAATVTLVDHRSPATNSAIAELAPIARTYDDDVIIETPRQGRKAPIPSVISDIGGDTNPYGAGYIERIYQLQG